jgi:hypothetical protein
MMLNPTKCTFRVAVGKLLSYLVSKRGIDANPSKIKAISDMKSPRTKKEVQKLAGTMTTPSRYLSKSDERGMSSYKLLRNANECG